MRLCYDLHLHSCLSPCGGGEMTPANLAGICRLAGLDVVALTDHNTAGNCAAFCRAAEGHGLLALPGMELCTREEIHVLCLFSTLEGAMACSDYVARRLPSIRNNPDLFGPQIYMDEGDGVLGEETAFLAGAADIGVDEVTGLISSFGGICYPAHIDRPSYALLSVLGLWEPSLGFPLAEVSPRCPPELRLRPDLADVRLITSSDAHDLEQVLEASHAMEVEERSPRAVLDWLARGGR